MDDPGRRLAAVPMLAGVGVVIGTWALLPRYLGPQLELGPRGPELEFVDHTVPGATVILLSFVAVLVGRQGSAAAANRVFAAGLGVGLAGVWMTATHLPLVRQAVQDEAPWGATLHHSLPALAVLLLGIGWCLVFRARAARPAPADGPP